VILEKGEIALRFDSKEGSFSAWYYQHCFPISPRCYAQILEAGGQPLTGIGREFSAIDQCPATSARERAAELKHWLAERATEPSFSRAIEIALKQFGGEPGNSLAGLKQRSV
jgi:(1->4)-alpha-D-glucan 1-alpha-D-glucosylmutase